FPAGAGVRPRAADRRAGRGHHNTGGICRPQRPALCIHRTLADRQGRIGRRPGFDAEYTGLGAAQPAARARNAQCQSGCGVFSRRGRHRPRARSQGRLRHSAGAASFHCRGRRFRAAGCAGVPGHDVAGFRPAAAAPGIRARYRRRHPRRRAGRLLLGIWRRGRRPGGPHETARPEVGAVAPAGRGAQRAMTRQMVVCGAGIIGLASALALARRGLRVALLAPASTVPAADPDTYHPRVYAISPASQKFLAGLGIWDALPTARITPVQAMEIHGDADGRVDLDAWHAAQPQLAWIVESGEIERVLIQAVRMFAIPWLPERCVGYRDGAVETSSGQWLRAELFVGADGASSPLRAAAGIAHKSVPYEDTGLVAHLDAERPHHGTAFQWFRDDGVLALLPLPDTSAGPQVSMVWSMHNPQAAALQALAPQEQ